MNVENIQRVIDRIRSLPDERLNMREWVAPISPKDKFDLIVNDDDIDTTYADLFDKLRADDCGTCGCAGGWILATLSDSKTIDQVLIGELFDIPLQQVQQICLPGCWDTPDNVYDAKPKHVANLFSNLIETGDVDWWVAFGDEAEGKREYESLS